MTAIKLSVPEVKIISFCVHYCSLILEFKIELISVAIPP